MAKAQFAGRIIPKNKQITLIVPISMSNTSQTKDGFEALIDLVISTKSIHEIEIIIGADLYAYYWGEQVAAEQEARWRVENAFALQRLEISGKTYKLISWNELKALPDFEFNEKKIKQIYQEDKNFYCNFSITPGNGPLYRSSFN